MYQVYIVMSFKYHLFGLRITYEEPFQVFFTQKQKLYHTQIDKKKLYNKKTKYKSFFLIYFCVITYFRIISRITRNW